jgi:hypothetical protein
MLLTHRGTGSASRIPGPLLTTLTELLSLSAPLLPHLKDEQNNASHRNNTCEVFSRTAGLTHIHVYACCYGSNVFPKFMCWELNL